MAYSVTMNRGPYAYERDGVTRWISCHILQSMDGTVHLSVWTGDREDQADEKPDDALDASIAPFDPLSGQADETAPATAGRMVRTLLPDGLEEGLIAQIVEEVEEAVAVLVPREEPIDPEPRAQF